MFALNWMLTAALAARTTVCFSHPKMLCLGCCDAERAEFCVPRCLSVAWPGEGDRLPFVSTGTRGGEHSTVRLISAPCFLQKCSSSWIWLSCMWKLEFWLFRTWEVSRKGRWAQSEGRLLSVVLPNTTQLSATPSHGKTLPWQNPAVLSHFLSVLAKCVLRVLLGCVCVGQGDLVRCRQ